MLIALFLYAISTVDARLRDKISLKESDGAMVRSYKAVYNSYLSHFGKQYEGKKAIKEHFINFCTRISSLLGGTVLPENFISFEGLKAGDPVPIGGTERSLTASFDEGPQESDQLLRVKGNEKIGISFDESYTMLKLYYPEEEAQALIKRMEDGTLDAQAQRIKWESMTVIQRKELKNKDKDAYYDMRLLEQIIPLAASSEDEEPAERRNGGTTERLLRLSNKWVDITKELGEPYEIRSSINYRKKHLSEPLEQHSKCGACFAHTAVSFMQSQVKIQKLGDPEMSVQHAVNCSPPGACEYGGLISQVWEFIRIKGIFKRTHKEKVKYQFPCSKDKSLPRYKVDYHLQRKDATVINMVNILHSGLGVVTVDFPTTIHNIEEGYIVGPDSCNPYSMSNNHGLIITGYHRSENLSYFRVLNVWGPGWGKDGFFYLYINKFNKDPITCALVDKFIFSLYVLSISYN